MTRLPSSHVNCSCAHHVHSNCGGSSGTRAGGTAHTRPEVVLRELLGLVHQLQGRCRGGWSRGKAEFGASTGIGHPRTQHTHQGSYAVSVTGCLEQFVLCPNFPPSYGIFTYSHSLEYLWQVRSLETRGSSLQATLDGILQINRWRNVSPLFLGDKI